MFFILDTPKIDVNKEMEADETSTTTALEETNVSDESHEHKKCEISSPKENESSSALNDISSIDERSEEGNDELASQLQEDSLNVNQIAGRDIESCATVNLECRSEESPQNKLNTNINESEENSSDKKLDLVNSVNDETIKETDDVSTNQSEINEIERNNQFAEVKEKIDESNVLQEKISELPPEKLPQVKSDEKAIDNVDNSAEVKENEQKIVPARPSTSFLIEETPPTSPENIENILPQTPPDIEPEHEPNEEQTLIVENAKQFHEKQETGPKSVESKDSPMLKTETSQDEFASKSLPQASNQIIDDEPKEPLSTEGVNRSGEKVISHVSDETQTKIDESKTTESEMEFEEQVDEAKCSLVESEISSEKEPVDILVPHNVKDSVTNDNPQEQKKQKESDKANESPESPQKMEATEKTEELKDFQEEVVIENEPIKSPSVANTETTEEMDTCNEKIVNENERIETFLQSHQTTFPEDNKAFDNIDTSEVIEEKSIDGPSQQDFAVENEENNSNEQQHIVEIQQSDAPKTDLVEINSLEKIESSEKEESEKVCEKKSNNLEPEEESNAQVQVSIDKEESQLEVVSASSPNVDSQDKEEDERENTKIPLVDSDFVSEIATGEKFGNEQESEIQTKELTDDYVDNELENKETTIEILQEPSLVKEQESETKIETNALLSESKNVDLENKETFVHIRPVDKEQESEIQTNKLTVEADFKNESVDLKPDQSLDKEQESEIQANELTVEADSKNNEQESKIQANELSDNLVHGELENKETLVDIQPTSSIEIETLKNPAETEENVLIHESVNDENKQAFVDILPETSLDKERESESTNNFVDSELEKEETIDKIKLEKESMNDVVDKLQNENEPNENESDDECGNDFASPQSPEEMELSYDAEVNVADEKESDSNDEEDLSEKVKISSKENVEQDVHHESLEQDSTIKVNHKEQETTPVLKEIVAAPVLVEKPKIEVKLTTDNFATPPTTRKRKLSERKSISESDSDAVTDSVSHDNLSNEDEEEEEVVVTKKPRIRAKVIATRNTRATRQSARVSDESKKPLVSNAPTNEVESTSKDTTLNNTEEAEEKTLQNIKFDYDENEDVAANIAAIKTLIRKDPVKETEESNKSSDDETNKKKTMAKKSRKAKRGRAAIKRAEDQGSSSDDEIKSPKITPDSKRTKTTDANEEEEGEKVGSKKKRESGGRGLLKYIDTSLVIETVESEAPIRQSRRIAQQKIREETERRQMEEKLLKQMKENAERKKTHVTDYIPDPDEEEKESSDASEYKEESRKKKKKKLKPSDKPWQTSSSQSEHTQTEDEFEHPRSEDPGSPLFKSDHEFSPGKCCLSKLKLETKFFFFFVESDDDDDATPIQPLKRARTAKKQVEESSDDEDVNPNHACQVCHKTDSPEWILLCDECDHGYHCSCLKPIIFCIPSGNWYCPLCCHKKLIDNLSIQLEKLDTLVSEIEAEELRVQKQLEIQKLTEISEQNILNEKRKNRIEHEERKLSRRELSESSDENSESSDNSSDNAPLAYKLRKRNQTTASYRFNDYDELINSAIRRDMDEVKGLGNAGRGKDISTIIEADKEEKKQQSQLDREKGDSDGGDERIEKAKEEDSSDSDVVRPKKSMLSKKKMKKKKNRKLNNLDATSEEDQASDEDFKGE
jgi:remodeling and spacing factor 1